MKPTFAAIASILAILGNIPYVVDIFRGRVKPHSYTWFVWSLVSGMVLFGQLAKGAGVGAWPTAVSWFFTLSIFFLSLKFGFAHTSGTDTIYLILALVGLIPWVLTDDPTLSVAIAVCIDVLAFIPTFRKTIADPSTETPTLYGMNVVRHALALLSLEAYNIATTLHAGAMIVTNSLMIPLAFRRKPEFHRRHANLKRTV